MHIKEVFTLVIKENLVTSQISKKQVVVGTSWSEFGGVFFMMWVTGVWGFIYFRLQQ